MATPTKADVLNDIQSAPLVQNLPIELQNDQKRRRQVIV